MGTHKSKDNSNKMAIRLISRSRPCVEFALLTTAINIMISFLVVWYSSSPSTSSSPSHQDSRLLLSVEYTGDSAPSPSSSSTLPSTITVPPSSQGTLDKYRLFKTHMFSRTGASWESLSSRKVCLGAQTSVDRLYWLVELVNQWTGPVSIALFTPDVELGIGLRYIEFLSQCFPGIRDRVSFHMTAPLYKPGVDAVIEMGLDEVVGQIPCNDHKKFLKFLLDSRPSSMLAWRESLAYPQNLLRNVAKSGCQTEYTYIPDIDMLPTPGMDMELEQFLQRQEERGNCSKCAYVVPTYEISNNATHTPVNKTELLQFVKKKLARQFHQAVYSINQKSSDLKRWEKMEQAEVMDVAYGVDKYIFKYEPLYVAKADTPPFDERFIGFGMTRNTQVYEMYVAGYTFHVLNNAFTNHWGFQSVATRPDWRARQQEKNNAKFDEFAKEVSARYGRDPYNMLSQLKKLNLKHVKVAYGVSKKKTETKIVTKNDTHIEESVKKSDKI